MITEKIALQFRFLYHLNVKGTLKKDVLNPCDRRPIFNEAVRWYLVLHSFNIVHEK